jgi:hypothetical protein
MDQPLRFWAEAHIRALVPRSKFFILECRVGDAGAVPGDEVSIASNDAGFVALCLDQHKSPDAAAALLGLDGRDLPVLGLVRERPSGDAVWVDLSGGEEAAAAAGGGEGARVLSKSLPPKLASLRAAQQLLVARMSRAQQHRAEGAGRRGVGATGAKLIVSNIHSYYTRQLMEPVTRGFLSILEKQFPRNDLYLFELLQNAVDDGARTVTLAIQKSGGGGGRGGSSDDGTKLVFSHDGRRFDPLDIWGLSSVGMSTKSGRSIGFMGIGFKAVYKRFGDVHILDDTWSMRFREHKRPGVVDIGWVLLPSWM